MTYEDIRFRPKKSTYRNDYSPQPQGCLPIVLSSWDNYRYIPLTEYSILLSLVSFALALLQKFFREHSVPQCFVILTAPEALNAPLQKSLLPWKPGLCQTVLLVCLQNIQFWKPKFPLLPKTCNTDCFPYT